MMPQMRLQINDLPTRNALLVIPSKDIKDLQFISFKRRLNEHTHYEVREKILTVIDTQRLQAS